MTSRPSTRSSSRSSRRTRARSRSTPSPTRARSCCGRSASTSRTPACTAATRRWCCRRRRSTSRRSAGSGRSPPSSRERCEITGPFNMQFLAKHNAVKVIECNLRASRSFPFVSKVTGHELRRARRCGGCSVCAAPVENDSLDLDYRRRSRRRCSPSRGCVGADPMLGVEMASTGEVGCFGDDLHEALLHALLATGFRFPRRACCCRSGPSQDKYWFADEARVIAEELASRSTRRPAPPRCSADRHRLHRRRETGRPAAQCDRAIDGARSIS